MNVPPTIGMALSAAGDKQSALRALQTDLSVEDLHDILEVILIDAHNSRIIAKAQADARRRS